MTHSTRVGQRRVASGRFAGCSLSTGKTHSKCGRGRRVLQQQFKLGQPTARQSIITSHPPAALVQLQRPDRHGCISIPVVAEDTQIGVTRRPARACLRACRLRLNSTLLFRFCELRVLALAARGFIAMCTPRLLNHHIVCHDHVLCFTWMVALYAQKVDRAAARGGLHLPQLVLSGSGSKGDEDARLCVSGYLYFSCANPVSSDPECHVATVNRMWRSSSTARSGVDNGFENRWVAWRWTHPKAFMRS